MKKDINRDLPKDQFAYRYDAVPRWLSYRYQIEQVLKLRCEKVLEIGIGNMTTSDYFRKHGLTLTTMDINLNLAPDCLGDVTKMPFKDNEFEVILCSEVLEHLPFEKSKEAVFELRRVSSEYAIVSVPHFSISFSLSVSIRPLFDYFYKIPLMSSNLVKSFNFRLPLPIKHIFDGEHYWEIGKRNYPLRRIRRMFSDAGFRIIAEGSPMLNPPHHFFILKK